MTDISDIQERDDKIEITFCNDEGYDIMKIYTSKSSIWEIVDFAKKKLSYAAKKANQNQ